MSDWKNKLYYGDSLYIMSEHIEDESADLIYLEWLISDIRKLK